MTLTARALSVIPDKTIVLTGALAPARFNESDAAFNLGMAFAIAQTASPGIYITMMDLSFGATRSRRIASGVPSY
jgi:L-asparaginase